MNSHNFVRAIVVFSILVAATLSSFAAQKQVLTIYTYDAFAADWGPAPKIKEKFEIECDCVLKFVAADSSIGALRKVQLEGKNTQADIVLGLDTNIAQAARETGLFDTHNIDADLLTIPNSNPNSDNDASWTDTVFLPFDYSYFSFVYNKEKTKTVPTSFEELAAMPDDFKIIIQDPRSSTPGLGLLLWIKSAYGDKAAQIWQSIAPKILTISKGWSDAYGLFLKGEADMVLSYTTSPAYHMIAEDDFRFASAKFTEGHYLQIEVAGMLKSSKQPALARRFLAFMLSDEFQDIIPTTNWTYPVRTTVKGLPDKFSALHLPGKSLLMDGKIVEKSRKQWIAEWLASVGN